MNSPRNAIIGQPIISLQTGRIVAWVSQPILEITTFKIVGLLCQSAANKQNLLLISGDIRQYAPDCIIIDNEDELTDPSDIVRLSSSLKNRYSPLGKPVVDESGRKLGTVEDYSINLDSNHIQKLYVRKSLIHALLGSNFIIDRTQIIDITPNRITVRDLTIPTPILSADSVPET
jgi:sporulation protein YlmC with PRC-barrel domain